MLIICSQSFIIKETKGTIRNRTSHNAPFDSLLSPGWTGTSNKGCFNILSTAVQLMEESNSNSRIIDLTGDNESVPEFVDLSKDPSCQLLFFFKRLASRSIWQWHFHQRGILVFQQDWWDIRSSTSLIDWNTDYVLLSGTRRRTFLPQWGGLSLKAPREHPDCSMVLKMKMEKSAGSPSIKSTAAFNTAKCRNLLSDPEQTAIKDHLLVCCTPSPMDPL